MKASEEFLLLILHTYTIAATEQCQTDTDTCIPLAKRIVSEFVNISMPGEQHPKPLSDMLFNYSTDLLSYLLWHGFHDAIHEGDGDRIFTYWKFLTVIFQQERHFNYAKEGLTLTIQSQILSERKIEELKWSRTVNTSGQEGHNIACDLYMEHLNRRIKMMMADIGSNKLQ